MIPFIVGLSEFPDKTWQAHRKRKLSAPGKKLSRPESQLLNLAASEARRPASVLKGLKKKGIRFGTPFLIYFSF